MDSDSVEVLRPMDRVRDDPSIEAARTANRLRDDLHGAVPLASTINFQARLTRANNAVGRVDTAGSIAVR